MPLIKSRSKAAIGANMSELMSAFARKGKIGNTTPKNKKHARKVALAISLNMKAPKGK